MDKETLKLKKWEKLQIEVEWKIIEIETEAVDPTENAGKALGSFMNKIAEILPELKGEKGDTGQKGEKGDPGGPRGEKGEKGDKGEKWDQGEKGEKGDPGKDGRDGRDGRNGKDGTNGKDGERGARGPQGDIGPRGMGVIGPAGANAYQIAVANGFAGTEAEWLASLVGPQGPPGSWTSANEVTGETPTGAINSVNIYYALAHTPTGSSAKVYLNGIRQKDAIDYTISSNIISMTLAPIPGDTLSVDYTY